MFDTPVEITWKGDVNNAKSTRLIASADAGHGQIVDVYFSPLIYGFNAVAITFLCDKQPTNHAVAVKVFNIVVQSFVQYFEKYNQPEIIIYSADIPSMSKLHKRIHSIYTTKNIGYKNVTWDELPEDFRGMLHIPNMENVISMKI